MKFALTAQRGEGQGQSHGGQLKATAVSWDPISRQIYVNAQGNNGSKGAGFAEAGDGQTNYSMSLVIDAATTEKLMKALLKGAFKP